MRRLFTTALLGLATTLSALPAAAQGFAAYISPPRFELQPVPGETLRQVVEIQHVGREKGNYRIYTNDWVFNADNSVTFSDALAADSCRPWVAIERRELAIEPGARYRYRFEITPPAGTRRASAALPSWSRAWKRPRSKASSTSPWVGASASSSTPPSAAPLRSWRSPPPAWPRSTASPRR